MNKNPNNKEYSQMRKDFYKSYKTKIVPAVKKFENERKTKLILAIISVTLIVIIGIAITFILGIGDLKLLGVIFLCAYVVWASIKKSFEKSIKEKIMPTICKCFGDMKWYHGKYTEGIVFSDSGVIPSGYDSVEFDDIFEGSYKNVKFEIVEAIYYKNSGKNAIVFFDGVLIKLQMNKRFSSHTFIGPHREVHPSSYLGLEYTELEDPEFNSEFDVYTSDQIDGRYLITPSFMERLKNVEIAFMAMAEGMNCAFYDDYFIIGLVTDKDLFSLGSLVKPIDDKQQYLEMYEEIVSIIKLIDHFKLNEKIGL